MIKDTRLRILTTIGPGGNNPSKKACGPGPTGRCNTYVACLAPQDKVKANVVWIVPDFHASDSEFKIDFGVKS